ncbi:MAG: FAD-dependent oxidoreductase [Bacteroidota bacterium]
MRNYLYLCFCFLFFNFSCKPVENLTCEVLVIGGGASGTTAAIQAARSGSQVILVEETPWLGGMLTSAGVSATDGNHRLPSGLWGEFRNKLYDHYGGPEAIATGWVSYTLFEPHIGNQVWNELADAEENLQRIHGYRLTEVEVEGRKVKGATFEGEGRKRLAVQAQVSIEATELGDVLHQAGAKYFTGNDTPENPHDGNIQDLTYAAILKDYGPEANKTIPKPRDYDPEWFHCICKEVCQEDTVEVMDCEQMLNYARLPGDKYMLNWPHNGNDYFLNPIEMTAKEREKAYEAAKNKTLGLIYFLQTEAGYSNLGLADDEFPTEDKLPFIPYYRESRRVKGKVRLKVADISDPYADPQRPFYRQAIAVGDYPLDHHHKEKSVIPIEDFPPIPSFSVPYQVMIPEELKGLIVAEKSISVSYLVNGASRLQPVVMTLGQAAGAAAAMSVQMQKNPGDIPLIELQQELLEAGCWLMPFLDIAPNEPDYQAIQRVGVAGWMRGTGIPFEWANQTWFYPDSCVTEATLDQALARAKAHPDVLPNLPHLRNPQCISWSESILRLWQTTRQQTQVDPIFNENAKGLLLTQAIEFFQEQGLIDSQPTYDLDRPLRRRELAVWLDKLFQPFGE